MHTASDENLDPRRRPRSVQRRDWASMSRTIVIGRRLQDLLAALLARR